MVSNIQVLDTHQQRIIVPFKNKYEVVLDKLEKAFPLQQSAPDIAKGKTWSEAVEHVDAGTPFDMILYRTRDVGAVMSLDNATQKCHYFLVGNFTKVSQAFKVDPSIFTIAPFHWCLFEDSDGQAKLSFYRPRLLFEQWGQPDIAKHGVFFDRKIAKLLEHIGAPVPDVLLQE